ncbi:DeoR/GlpR family DNA-binding transcription regulator [Kiloniella sp. b19]|uniref:DeoR/GlpR family DNA-binding transcription regulator n=1 Tax=Kiloniella sp. GXU_MW_B19 TaxID=3141326 RepID=UPI0031DB1FF9
MELTQRQLEILTTIRADGSVEVDRLATHYNVTTQTVRRDLAVLCQRGLAMRTHGGARQMVSVSNQDYSERRVQQIEEKKRIAELAAGLIPNRCSVALNIGTTTEQVALALSRHEQLIVLSNNVNIIASFFGSQVKELIQVGGSVRQSDGAVIGEEAVSFISRYKVDYAILGASALDEDGDILDYDGREVAVSRAIMANARVNILVCDSSKFERSAPYKICHAADLDYIIMEQTPPAGFRQMAEAGGAKIICP